MKVFTVFEKSKINIDKLCYLFLIFLIGGLVGWIYEEIFYRIAEGVFQNRGVLYGPWIPIYGIGALGIYVAKPLKKNPLLLFGVCVIVTGIVEYIIGFIGIHFFDMRLWDYRGMFLNIGGVVCFRSVISFGLLGLLFHYLIEPYSERLFKKFSEKAKISVCVLLAAAFALDVILSALFRTPITY